MFDGWYYNGRDARALAVHCAGGAGVLTIRGEGLDESIELERIGVSPRLGRTRRVLNLPGGAQLHSDDNDAIDALFPHHNAVEALVDRLERHWRAALASVVVTLVAFAFFFTVGLPWLADRAAQKVPAAVERAMGEQALSLLQQVLLKESTLSAERRAALSKRFAAFVSDIPGGRDYRVEFFHAGDMANAFALPGGTIVFTDDIVQMFDNDEEFLAVAAHEIGHEQHRHMLRLILRDSAVAVLAALMAGDVASASTLVVAIPTFLLQNHYTRTFEADADDYALTALAAHGVSPRAFAQVMRKFETKYPELKDASMAYAATHPPTAERIEHAEQAARAFEAR